MQHKKKRHILFLTWKDMKHPHAGGAERVMYEYALRLVRAGYHVTWFASLYPGAPETENLDDIHITRKYSAHTIWIFAWWWYQKYKKKHHIDIIIDEAGGWPLLSLLYERKIPIYFFAHHIGDKEFHAYPWPIGTLAKRVYRILIGLYHDTPTITVSSSTRDELVDEFGFTYDAITVIENTTELISLDVVNTGEKTTDFVFLGRLTAIKRPIDAVLAYEKALSRLPSESRLHIIGNAQDRTYVSELGEIIKKHHLTERVIIHGYLTKEDFSRILRQSRALLVPSEKEGYGLVVLEANAQGTPVIVYDVAGLRDSTHHGVNGIIVPYGDTDAMADAMVDMVANRENYDTLCASSLAYMQSIPTWDTQTQKLISLITSDTP